VKQPPKSVTTPVSDTARLGGIRGLPHDDDERPSREDAAYGQTIFTHGTVPLPRWLVRSPRKKRR
jgi:hypothetical protein